MRFAIVAVTVSMLAATAAGAQVQPRDAQGRPVTVIDIDADVIEGTPQRPSGEIVRPTPRPIHKSLIQLRKDFRGEMLASGSLL